MDLKPYWQPTSPSWWMAMAVGASCTLAVLLALSPPPGVAEALAEAEKENPNLVCDGVYCGGPFFQSPLGLIVMVSVPLGLVGLILTFIKARKPGAMP